MCPEKKGTWTHFKIKSSMLPSFRNRPKNTTIMRITKGRLVLFLLTPLFFSCAKRNLSYFDNYDKTKVLTEQISTTSKEPVLQTGDRLQIIVTSANPLAAAPFNRIAQATANVNTIAATSEISPEGYLVDENGIIDFPVLGRIKVGGMTKSEAKVNLTSLLTNYLGNPVVSIRYLNYRITVIGEVKNPNTFLVPSERINVIQALGMAGDMTVFGKRENVMIMNETKGTRTVAHLNLNEKEVLDSPYFYLQPNDVVYVEAVKSRRDQASLSRSNISLLLAAVTAASLVILTLR